MDRPPQQSYMFLIVLAAIKILLLSHFIQSSKVQALSSSSTSSSTAQTKIFTHHRSYFQPALIGFRCEGANEQTLDGITVIEANSPVRITLFGEAFTTDTIVAFTTELVRQEADIVDQVISSNLAADPSLPYESSTQTSDSETETTTDAPKGRLQFEDPSTKGNNSEQQQQQLVSGPNQPQQLTRSVNNLVASRKFKRRLLGKNYDCTDYDRVISYKLGEDNIITPNVAVLTIRLPELDWSSQGKHYYFCLKQPPIPSAKSASSCLDNEATNATSSNYTSNDLNSADNALVWVHQGDEWWLSLKAEPPILSVANDCVLIVLLLFLSAVTSGLNLGLMSLDMNELAVISSCGDPRERSYARTIAPLRKRGNYLLCSLLLGNVMVNSTLTVILEEMTSGVVAVIGSTLAIVVLGEIVPQAFCARQGLAIGARTIYLTYLFMIITFPLSYPISCLLDCVLGEEKGNVYDRERLMEFIRITGNHTQLEADEVAIISGALKLKKIKVDQIMTRIEDVFMLPIDCMLNRETIKRIIEKGYSRIPIYEFGDRKQIVALILAKDLALLDPDDQVPLANMLMYCKHPLIFIDDTATLDVALNEFKTGKSHMAIVRQIYDDGEVDKYYEAIGVVTLEDVIEEVLQTEINDETDTLSDNRRKRRRTDAQVAHLVENLAQQLPNLTGSSTTSNSTKF